MRARAVEAKRLMTNVVCLAAGPGGAAHFELAADVRPARKDDAVGGVWIRVLFDLRVVQELERSEDKIGVEGIPRRKEPEDFCELALEFNGVGVHAGFLVAATDD